MNDVPPDVPALLCRVSTRSRLTHFTYDGEVTLCNRRVHVLVRRIDNQMPVPATNTIEYPDLIADTHVCKLCLHRART